LDHDATLTPSEPIPPTEASVLRKIIIGKDGLRAGWSLLIFIALAGAIAFCVFRITEKLLPPALKLAETTSHTSATPSLFIVVSLPFFAILLASWIMSKIERRPNSVYGLGRSRMIPNFLVGLAWGVTCYSLLVLTLWKTGFLLIDNPLLSSRDILRYGTIWLLLYVLVGLSFEYFFRGYVQYTLTRGLAGLYQGVFMTRHSAALGFWTSATIVSLIFGNPPSNIPSGSTIGTLSASFASMVFFLSLWRTGSLWWAIGFHTSWAWAQYFLYGVPLNGQRAQPHLLTTHSVGKPILSGGAIGPEGSVFMLAILALASLIIVFTLPRAQYGGTPDPSTKLQAGGA
jgi:hypothetical protein